MSGKRITSLLTPVIVAIAFGCVLSAAPAAGDTEGFHVASSSSLHQAVVSHTERVTQARHYVSEILSHPQVGAQVRRMGVDPSRLQQRVAVLEASEILDLQRQIMPMAEQMRTAGQSSDKNRYLIPILAVGVAAATVAMFMFYS